MNLLYLRFLTVNNTEVTVKVQDVAAMESNPLGVTMPGVSIEPQKESLDPCPVSEAAILDATTPVDPQDLPPLVKITRTPILRLHFGAGGHLDVLGTREDWMRKLRIAVEKVGGAHQRVDPPLVQPVKAGVVDMTKGPR